MRRHPDAFSKSNRAILAGEVQVRGKGGKLVTLTSPKNDAAFRKYFQQYDVPELHNTTLIHHHIGGGGQAFGIPAPLHPGSGGIHNIEKAVGIWDAELSISQLLQRFLD